MGKIMIHPSVKSCVIDIEGTLILGFGLKLLMSDLPAAILIDSVKALGRICEGIGIAL